jgi:hypothetical protein
MSQPSFTVNYYSLFLGNQDSVTGQFQKGYVPESIRMAIVPKAFVSRLSGLGLYSRHDAVGITNYEVRVGCIVQDTHGTYYEIMSRQPHTWGDQFGYYSVDLRERRDFPFITGYFGFEIIAGTMTNITVGFDEHFERGYWAL